MEFRYGSVCTGLGTEHLAFPKEWRCAWYAEIDPYCREFLRREYPGVPNMGDIVSAPVSCFSAVDLVIGGTPCQPFSVNRGTLGPDKGAKLGLDDKHGRGNVTLRYCEIIEQSRPRWFIWENVPNVLRVHGGRAFSCLVGRLAELGYSCVWTVLDSGSFGVPQGRRRLFVVGHADPRFAAGAVTHRQAGVADGREVGEVREERWSAVGSPDSLLGWTGDETPKYRVEMVPTLRGQQGGEQVGLVGGGECRQLSPEEWEFCQGFPPGYTKLPGWGWSHRKRAIGNAFCVPVVRWIAGNIAYLEGR